MDTHKPEPKDFIKIAANYAAAEKTCGNICAGDVARVEVLYLRALSDDFRFPLKDNKTRTSLVEELIVSKAQSRLTRILETTPLGQAALKSRK